MIAPASNFLGGTIPKWRPGRIWQDPAGPVMIDIPPGWFTMGENPGDRFAGEAERPAHEVSISPGLALSVAPVTVAEFRQFRGPFMPGEEASLPAIQVSWIDAAEYCAWLSLKTGLPYRLPSEAEWEFACRAGSIAAYTFGDELSPGMANYLHAANGAPAGHGPAHPGRHISAQCLRPPRCPRQCLRMGRRCLASHLSRRSRGGLRVEWRRGTARCARRRVGFSPAAPAQLSSRFASRAIAAATMSAFASPSALKFPNRPRNRTNRPTRPFFLFPWRSRFRILPG